MGIPELIGAAAMGWEGYKRYKSWSSGGGGASRPHRGAFAYRKKKHYKAMKLACRPEMHYVDTSYGTIGSSYVPSVGGSCLPLNAAIGAGTEFNQRNGRNIIGKYLQYDINLWPPATAGNFDAYHVAFVCDKLPAGTAPTYAQIYDTSVNPVGVCFKNIASYGDRFAVLKTMKGTVQNGSPDVPIRLTGMIKIPMRLARVTYTGTSVGQPECSGFYCLVASEQNTGSNSTCWYGQLNFRFGYHDC
jgi:hypothetical protein